VRIVVGFAPGGGTDIAARLIGQSLSERLGQSFFVENRPGATGNIATEAVVRSPPDGYTLLLVGTSNAINATLFDRVNYNFIRDIMPVASIYRVPGVVLATQSFPAKSLPEFIAYAAAKPNEINFASAGIGSASHIYGELFKMLTRVNIVHVPYRSTGPGLTDLLGGQVHA
jgi:tripartite-type tricarboxylate transporter receptor subunit TctC